MNFNPFAHYTTKIPFYEEPYFARPKPINIVQRVFGSTFSMGIFDYLLIVPFILKLLLSRHLINIMAYNKNLYLDSIERTPEGDAFRSQIYAIKKSATLASLAYRALYAPFFLIKTILFMAVSPLVLIVGVITQLVNKLFPSPHTKLLDSLLRSPSLHLPLHWQPKPIRNGKVENYEFWKHEESTKLYLRHWYRANNGVIEATRENILTLHKLLISPKYLADSPWQARPHRPSQFTTEPDPLSQQEVQAWVDRFRYPVLKEIERNRIYRLLVTHGQRNLPQEQAHFLDIPKDVRKIICFMLFGPQFTPALQRNDENNSVQRIQI